MATRRALADMTKVAIVALVLSPHAPSAGQVCPCDCNGDDVVRVGELVTSVNIATDRADAATCVAADGDGNGSVAVNELVRCVRVALDGCAAVLGGPPPGLRRFSLDPGESQLITTLPNGVDFPSAGFSGFLDLRTNRTLAPSIFFINVVDASEYLSIGIPANAVAVCVRPLRDQFPVNRAGVLYCSDGNQVGLSLEQDRNIGIVETCVEDGAPCQMDDDCATGTCFLADDCAAAGGTVDTSGFGSCIGPVGGVLLPDTSPAGAALISPDPIGGQIVGLPVEIVTEVSLPCGDEPDAVGLTTEISLTTGSAVAILSDVNNEPGTTLEAEHVGSVFHCDRWTGEDGAGTLIFSAPVLDVDIAGAPTDAISTFRWVD